MLGMFRLAEPVLVSQGIDVGVEVAGQKDKLRNQCLNL
jgi:hypothetical protein